MTPLTSKKLRSNPRAVTLLTCAGACALLATLASCRGETREAAGKHRAPVPLEDVSRLVNRYYARANPEVTVKVVSVGSSEKIPGWKQGTLEWSTGGEPQKMPFLVSLDGRYFIPGEVIDLAQDPLQAIMDKIELEGRPARGPAGADVIVVEYGDFQCPFSLRAYQTIEKGLLQKYGSRIRFYYKHLPLKKLHPWAELAAIAAECAADESPEAFWKLYNFFFQRQKEITQENIEATTRNWARQAGLNQEHFSACLRERRTSERVQADIAEAAAVGVSSTPTFIINGHKIVGAQPLEAFTDIIEKEGGKALAGQQP